MAVRTEIRNIEKQKWKESFREKFRFRRLYTSHFRGWQVYAENYETVACTECSAPQMSHVNCVFELYLKSWKTTMSVKIRVIRTKSTWRGV